MKKRQRKKIAKLWEQNSVRITMGIEFSQDTGRWSIKATGIRNTRQTRSYGRKQMKKFLTAIYS